MKFKNFEGKQYNVNYNKPPVKYNAVGLCENPDNKHPSIFVDPTLKTRRQLNVLIEEVFHAHLYDLPEKKARKFSANLGKLIYSRFIKK